LPDHLAVEEWLFFKEKVQSDPNFREDIFLDNVRDIGLDDLIDLELEENVVRAKLAPMRWLIQILREVRKYRRR